MITVALISIIGSQIASDREYVQKTVQQFIQDPMHYVGNTSYENFHALTIKHAPYIVELLPQINHPMPFRQVGKHLARQEYLPAIQPIIDLIDKDFPGSRGHPCESILMEYGYRATPALIRNLDSPSTKIRLVCESQLAARTRLEGNNPKVREAVSKLTNSNHSTQLFNALAGLDGFAYDWHLNSTFDYFKPTVIKDNKAHLDICKLAIQPEIREHVLAKLHMLIWTHVTTSKQLSQYKKPENFEYDNVKDFLPHRTHLNPQIRQATYALFADRSRRFRLSLELMKSKDVDDRSLGLHFASSAPEIDYSFLLPGLVELSKNSNPEIRKTAATALRYTPSDKAIQATRRLLKDLNPDVKKAANSTLNNLLLED